MAGGPFSISRALRARAPGRGGSSVLLNASVAIVGMTSLLLLVQISGVASLAYQVQRLEDQQTYWQESNYRAEADIARLQSLERIEEEAISRLKMVPAKDPIPVLVSRPLPAASLPPEALPATPPRALASDLWWHGILDILGQVWRGR